MLCKGRSFLCAISLLTVATALPTNDSVVNSEFNGKSLLAMGKALNNPLLKLLGKTFEKLEEDVDKDVKNKTSFVLDTMCRLHDCTQWTSWSRCSAIAAGTYGAQSRSRQCGVNAVGICAVKGQGLNETDVKICEGFCPQNYTVTTQGYCIGYRGIDMNLATAKTFCKHDGGYLVNINSKEKAADINDVLEKKSMSGFCFIIDGYRTLPNGEWRYDYDQMKSGYTNWRSGEPSSGDDCTFYSKSGVFSWLGQTCSTICYPICEIV